MTCCWASRCHGCGAAWWGVCPDCRTELAARHPRWARPDPCPAGFPRTVTSSTYDPLLRGLVNAHKERQALGLTPVLGRRLAQSVHGLLRARDVAPGAAVSLVPVPSAARAVRERGFDATAAMARAAARSLRPHYRAGVATILAQAAGVRDQSGLDARARQANLAGGFRLRGRPPDRPGRAGRRPGDHREQPDRGGPGAAPGGGCWSSGRPRWRRPSGGVGRAVMSAICRR